LGGDFALDWLNKSKIGGFVDVEIKIEGNGKSALNGNHPD